MTKYIVANWKSRKSPREAGAWLESFLGGYVAIPGLQVILAPSFLDLIPMRHMLQDRAVEGISLAAQDISSFPRGSYTGAVAAETLAGVAEYALVGHAERRRYFHESHQEIANKVSEAAAAGISPILCVDQPYAAAQLGALRDADCENMLIGYGPVQAIGINAPQSLGEAAKAIAAIRQLAPERPVLYGGSINGVNAAAYLAINGVAGLMAGTASLDPGEFLTICGVVGRS